MSAKERLRGQLEFSRNFTEGLLQNFKTPEDFVFQVHPNANHAMWFVGHISHSDNFFISIIDPSKAVEKEGYGELFGMGSQPTSDASAYPSPEEALAFLRERRATLLEVLDNLSEEDLDKPTPEGTPDFLPTISSVLEMAAWHEGLHAGQVTVASRGLGNRPVFSAAQDDAEG
ncbi:MAG: DinB family protein, partial [Pirellulales bacterium]|nr:DinB family protein [Pirellulales bacterium]